MTDDMMSEFVAEATDHLTRAEEILLALSRQPEQEDAEAINACFRSLHTIKGCSGFLDLPRIQHLSHAGEQILDALRTHELKGSAAVFDVLLLTVARLQSHIAQLDGQAATVPDTDDDCVQQLEGLRHAPVAPAAPAAPATPPTLSQVLSSVGGTTSTPVEETLDAISAAISELIVTGVGDVAAVNAVIERLAQRMLHGAWNPKSRSVMTRMRSLLDGLSGATALDNFQQILKQCGQLEALQRAMLASESSSDTAAPAPASVVASSAPMQPGDALGEFISEANELLNQAESTVIGQTSFDAEQVNCVFRAFHTVKGMAAYLDQPAVEHGAHRFEAQIQAVRDGTEKADESFAAKVLKGVDALRELVAGVKREMITGIQASAAPRAGEQPSASSTASSSGSSAMAGETQATTGPAGERLGDLLADVGVSRQAIEQTAATLKPGERIGDKLVAEGAVMC